MKAKGIVIFLFLMILFSFISANFSNTEEQEQEDIVSFIKASEHLKLSEELKGFYVGGLAGASFAILQYYVPEKYAIYKEATKGMTLLQLAKILDRYPEENPEKLHYNSAGVCFLHAIDEIAY